MYILSLLNIIYYKHTYNIDDPFILDEKKKINVKLTKI